MIKNKIISFKNLSKSFVVGNDEIKIFSHMHADIFEGEKVAIIGPSGSGKSTLLSLLTALDNPTEGDIEVCGKNLKELDEQERSLYRNKNISIIFQSFELITPFTVFENVVSPLEIRNDKKADIKKIGENLLERVGLISKKDLLTKSLSGGEKQRVAIARALSSSPDIIFADEPTGSLDRETGKKVLEMLIEQVDISGKTLVIITHDMEIAHKMDRVLEIKNGDLIEIKK